MRSEVLSSENGVQAMSARYNKRGGFTLVEVMVASCILYLVFSGAYDLVNSALRISKLSRRHFVAMHMAHNRLERARNFAYVNLYLMADNKVVLNDFGASDTNGQYRRTTTVVTNVPGFPNLSQVTVEVEIRDLQTGIFKGEKESVTTYLTLYVDKPGS